MKKTLKVSLEDVKKISGARVVTTAPAAPTAHNIGVRTHKTRTGSARKSIKK